MDHLELLGLYALCIFIAAEVAAVVAHLIRNVSTVVSFLNMFGAGVLLAAGLVHLLPDAADMFEAATAPPSNASSSNGTNDDADPFPFVYLTCSGGVYFFILLETVVLDCHSFIFRKTIRQHFHSAQECADERSDSTNSDSDVESVNPLREPLMGSEGSRDHLAESRSSKSVTFEDDFVRGIASTEAAPSSSSDHTDGGTSAASTSLTEVTVHVGEDEEDAGEEEHRHDHEDHSSGDVAHATHTEAQIRTVPQPTTSVADNHDGSKHGHAHSHGNGHGHGDGNKHQHEHQHGHQHEHARARENGHEPKHHHHGRHHSHNHSHAKGELEGRPRALSVHGHDIDAVGKKAFLAAILLILALSIHSFLAGFAMGVADTSSANAEFIAILAHKTVAALAAAAALVKTDISVCNYWYESPLLSK